MDNKKIFLIAAILAVFGFLASSVYLVLYKSQKSFDEKNISLKIESPRSLEAGEVFELELSYKNGNRVNLKNAFLTLSYPRQSFSDIKDESAFGKIRDSAITWDIGDISSGYEGIVKISAKAASAAAGKLTAELRYEPENFSSEFSSRAEHDFAVTPAKISLSLFAPGEAVAGQEIKYVLTYTNATSLNFDSIRIKFNYPSGFVFSRSFPAAGEDGSWEVQNFTRASSGQIEVAGILGIGGGEAKIVSALIEQKENDGRFIFNNEISAASSVINSPFAIVQLVNGKENYSAFAGETLNYKIRLRNLDSTGKKNLAVSAVLEGEGADYATLSAENASVDSDARLILWDGKTKKELADFESDKELEFAFSVKLKDKLPVVDDTNKNFSIKNTVSVKDGNVFDANGGNKAIISSSFDTKINSSVELFTRGYFNDDGRIKTFGPIPPKVGETTAYNLRWQILNSYNRVKNAKVVGVLPANVRWTGEVFPMDSKISYDIDTRTVTWEAGDLEPGTGIIFPLKEVVFQVSIAPAPENAGQYMVLIGQGSLSASDDFTLSEITAKSEGITTRLPDDISIGPEEGKVAM